MGSAPCSPSEKVYQGLAEAGAWMILQKMRQRPACLSTSQSQGQVKWNKGEARVTEARGKKKYYNGERRRRKRGKETRRHETGRERERKTKEREEAGSLFATESVCGRGRQ